MRSKKSLQLQRTAYDIRGPAHNRYACRLARAMSKYVASRLGFLNRDMSLISATMTIAELKQMLKCCKEALRLRQSVGHA